jgi:hypothetical protein
VSIATPKRNTRKNAMRFPRNPSKPYVSQKTDPQIVSDQLQVDPMLPPLLSSGLMAVYIAQGIFKNKNPISV